MWLLSLGAKVIGYSAYIPSKPSNFEVSGLKYDIEHVKGDVRDFKKLRSVLIKYKPEILFHLAAQPIVTTSYEDPKRTFDVNIGGTVNILECLRTTYSVHAAVIITSDKCYKNMEWFWGYRETDLLGGDDPYSSSKACAELVSNAYIKSFFPKESGARIATVRAGNVIGGGDWAKDRIVPDCVRAFSKGKKVIIRNPDATRPWQHVLEPLSGYLWLGSLLTKSSDHHGESFNFGPDHKVNETVKKLIGTFLKFWGEREYRVKQKEIIPKGEYIIDTVLRKSAS